MAGYERPMWFSKRQKAVYKYSYGKQNWYSSAKKESLSTRKNISLFELTPFVKFDISGKFSHNQLK